MTKIKLTKNNFINYDNIEINNRIKNNQDQFIKDDMRVLQLENGMILFQYD